MLAFWVSVPSSRRNRMTLPNLSSLALLELNALRVSPSAEHITRGYCAVSYRSGVHRSRRIIESRIRRSWA